MQIYTDLDHMFGGDLSLSSSGDLATVQPGGGYVQERLLRRLFTNPSDMLFHPEYGIGISSWVGRTFSDSDAQAIEALVLSNLLEEEDLVNPSVSATISDPTLVIVSVSATNAYTNEPLQFTFGVGTAH